MQSFINIIINQASTKGISQKALAASAGVPPETLSRMKRRPSARAGALERLALGAGLRLALVDAGVPDLGLGLVTDPLLSSPTPLPTPLNAHSSLPFTQKYRQLAWSNPNAPAEVFVRQALLKPDFSVLLDAAVEFGLDFVEAQWAVLMAEGSKEAVRARSATERTLRNIRGGYEQAC